MRPLNYFDGASTYGHYMVAAPTGAIAATLAAASPMSMIRWTDSSVKMVLLRCRAGLSVITAITASVIFDAELRIIRACTAIGDSTGTPTTVSMVAKPGSQSMRNNMAPSKLGANGPQFAGTTVLTNPVYVADTAAAAAMVWQPPSPTLGASAVTCQVGCATGMETLYEWTGHGQHPIVLGQNEGVIFSNITAGPATGTYKYYVEWTWAEVPASAI